jgi:hypothetical protein
MTKHLTMKGLIIGDWLGCRAEFDTSPNSSPSSTRDNNLENWDLAL